jgi:hypothetical protein
MSYSKFLFHGGIYKDGSPMEVKGHWIDRG